MLPLNKLLRDKLIPWAESGLEERLVTARATMKRTDLPAGVTIGKNKISGRRVAIHNKRHYGYRLYYAEWPEDKLHELTAPKLVCVTKGTTDYVAGEHVISCGEGHFILLPALVPNVYGGRSNLKKERGKDEHCELAQILVARDYVNCMFSLEDRDTVQEIANLNCTIYSQQAVRLFNEFAELAQAADKQNVRLLSHLLSAFFWVLLNEVNSGREVYTFYHTPPSLQQDRTIDELRDYIKANLRHSLTIEKMAQYLYLSPRQFTRYWRRETGHSFVETLTECRLEESKRFLIETHWTIAAIAYLVGFKSPAYFNTFFSRHMKCTPGEYRLEQTTK
jgi:AraC-like DNA-binding protein